MKQDNLQFMALAVARTSLNVAFNVTSYNLNICNVIITLQTKVTLDFGHYGALTSLIEKKLTVIV